MKKRTKLLLVLVAALCLCLGFGVFAACKKDDSGKKHVHDYSEWAYDGTEHWRVCPVDDAADESTRAEHTMEDGKCKVCGYEKAEVHTHAYTELRSDATSHWYECPEDGDYIVRFGHIYEEGKCVVCEKEGTAPGGVQMDTRTWYVAGSGAGDLNGIGWDALNEKTKMTKLVDPDADGNTVYSIRLKLYSADEFKFVQDLDWDDGLGYFGFGNLANGSEAFRDAGSGNITPKDGKDGIYEFYIRTKPDGGATANMVEYRLVEKVDALAVTEKYEMYIIGKIASIGSNWDTNPDKMIKMELLADGETFEAEADLVPEDTFKVYNLKTNNYYPTGTSNDLLVNRSDKYRITWKIGDLMPKVEEWKHEHRFTSWMHDDTNHWGMCPADNATDESNKAAHDYGDDNYCDVCGYEKANKPECATHTWGTDNVCMVCGRHWRYTEGLSYVPTEADDGYIVTGFIVSILPNDLTELVIPYGYNNKPVVAIGDRAFYDESAKKFANIQSVTLPDSVTKIGTYAFSAMTGLESVTFGKNLTELGERAFDECEMLQTVALPDGVKVLPAYVFSGCSRLYSITFSSTLEKIAGLDGTRLSEIVIPATVTEIGASAFYNCSTLTTVTFAPGSRLKTIGKNAFGCCGILQSIELPEGLETIGEGAFGGKHSRDGNTFVPIASIRIPASVKEIGENCFSYNTALTSVEFADPTGWIFSIDPLKLSGDRWAIGDPALLADAQVTAKWFTKEAGYILSDGSFTPAMKKADVGGHEHRFLMRTNNKYHWYVCSECGYFESALVEHDYDGDYYCKVCNYKHEHTFASTWTYDETGHWYETTCKHKDVKGSFAAHTLDDKTYKCKTCSFQHTHTYDEETWTYDETGHWHASTCGHDVRKNSTQHTFTEENVIYNTCRICGYEGVWQGENNGTPNLDFEINADRTGVIVKGFKTFPEDLATLTEIVIPAKVGKWDVVEIAAYAFWNDSGTTKGKFDNVTKVVIPASVTKVGGLAFSGLAKLAGTVDLSGAVVIDASAFNGCKLLEGVTLGDSLLEIGFGAFNGCAALTNVQLPASLRILGANNGAGAFTGCTSLQSITLPDGLTDLYQSTFQQCTQLKTVDLGKVKTIGTRAFFGCSMLTDVTLPDELVSIGGWAFQNCRALQKIDLKNVETIDNMAFMGCMQLSDITISTKLTSVHSTAFLNCTNFKTLKFPAGITKVDSWCQGFSSLESLDIPATVTEISAYAFSGCSKLTKVTLPDGLKTLGASAFNGCKLLATINLPAGLETIGENTFNGCAALTQVSLPEKVTEVGANAFNGCALLNTINLANVVKIGASAFAGCATLNTVDLTKANEIGENAFSGCTTLAQVTFSAGLRTIEAKTFQNCAALTQVTLPVNLTAIGDNAFNGCALLATINLEKVITIGASAFNGCAALNNVTLTALTTLGASAFKDCAALTAVTLPDAITEIGANTFENCALLATINLGKVATIGASAFKGCAVLDNVTLNKVATIGNSAFEGCSLLATVNFGTALTSIGNSAFKGCEKLDNVTLPATLETIGTNAFQNCTTLKAITLPEKITAIANYTFDGCTSLATVTLNAGLKTIGQYAFQGCTALTTIAIPASVYTISVTAFNGSGLTTATFADPEGWLVAASANGFEGDAVEKTTLTTAASAAQLLASNEEAATKYFRRIVRAD